MVIEGNLVDIHSQQIYFAHVEFEDGVIKSIRKVKGVCNCYILPGLIDSHVHIESSMTVPTRFAKMIVPRGTVGVVSDPHEIANVLGRKGVEFMIEEGNKTPLKCFFGVPSCVPATDFESSGGRIEVEDMEYLFLKGARFLAEMMNYPGVIFDDPKVKSKLNLAKQYNVPIDGHAPGIGGDHLNKYVSAGISTDHECSTLQEAIDKIALGMMIQIREGSAARNFDSLHTLIRSHPDHVMLCTDDSHPDLITSKGHIDRLIRLAISKGYSIFEIYKAAVLNPVRHYNLPVGLLREGDPADFIVVDDLIDFNVLETYIDGVRVGNDGMFLKELDGVEVVNNFVCDKIAVMDIVVKVPERAKSIKVIVAQDGELLTEELLWNINLPAGSDVHPKVEEDILKIVVVNRYQHSKPVVGFIKGFGLKAGAIASSVAHDSHNIVALGCDDHSLVEAINAIIDMKGGLVAFDDNRFEKLPLPIAGLMSDQEGDQVAKDYSKINEFVFSLGVTLNAPFMTLAFMPLLVIPKLKIGDKGLFDVSNFSFTDLFVLDE